MNKVLLVSLIAALGTSTAYAQGEAKKKSSTTSETAVKLEDVKPTQPAQGSTSDIDTEITNAKLRAESGSKSKWSGSFAGSYNGGSLEKPFSKDRPNPAREATPPRVNLGGGIDVRYRIDKRQSVTAGVGVKLERPLQEAKRGDVTNPNVGYNYVTKLGPVQSISSASAVLTTDNNERVFGSVGALGVSETLMYEVGTSGLSLGLAADASYTKYDMDANKIVTMKNGKTTAAGEGQESWNVGVYPLVEYAVTDKLSLRTVFRPWTFGHSPLQEEQTFTKKPWTQSFGVGYAVTRDIYLYPNFQWNVERWAKRNYDFSNKQVRSASTVGLNATINVF